jgi:hypothetical protein
MDSVCLRRSSGVREAGAQSNWEVRLLRNQLMNLTLGWELEALALDAKRYRAVGSEQKESLRDSALAYRKCIAKVTELLNSGSISACKSP